MSVLAADGSDFVVYTSVAVVAAATLGIGRWLVKRAIRTASDEFTAAITAIVTEVVEPQLAELRAQNVELQLTLNEGRAQNASDHASVVTRLEALERRLPPPPPDYPPPPGS